VCLLFEILGYLSTLLSTERRPLLETLSNESGLNKTLFNCQRAESPNGKPPRSGLVQQILGYGKGENAIFYETVLVPSRDMLSEELGLVTNKISDEKGNIIKLVVFVPGAPNPTSGRLLVIDKGTVRPLTMPVNETLKVLVSMGKTEMDLQGEIIDHTQP
jgi:hypothetical protein